MAGGTDRDRQTDNTYKIVNSAQAVHGQTYFNGRNVEANLWATALGGNHVLYVLRIDMAMSATEWVQDMT